jgi:glycosyltransferase involved in cell wall biosynthesis
MVEQAARQDPRVEFFGLLDSVGVAGVYADADILLNVRLTKTMNTRYFFPSKLIEYLGSGVPTITTRVAHAETEFADLAYILKDESPQGLADLITFVGAQSPEARNQLGRRAREYVSTHKTWDAQAARVARYLHEVIERDGNSAHGGVT